jgi:DNA-binding beta-propeller fold protein YncE
MFQRRLIDCCRLNFKFVLGIFLVALTAPSNRAATAFQESSDRPSVRLEFIGRYESGVYQKSGAEIVSYDPASKRAFVVNAFSGKIDVLDMNDPTKPTLLFSIDVSDLGADANSVAVQNGIVAIAVQASIKTDPGFVAFYDTDGNRKTFLQAGALPDAVTFSPDGRYVLVSNEGEPNDDYSIDPEGSVTIIDLSGGLDSIKQSKARTANFRAFNGREDELRAKGIRIFGPNASAAQDFEPEWTDVTSDSKTAYVCLQENNAIAVIDIATATVTDVFPLGFKDWSEKGKWAGRGFDASDKDDGINIRNWPVYGIFQPDTIKIYEVNGQTYIIGANEGDSRVYQGWSEEARVGDLNLDPNSFPDAATLQKDENLGRLQVTTTLGVCNDFNPSAFGASAKKDGVYDSLYAYGGRSMAIWRVSPKGMELVFDTGSQMEETIAAQFPKYFNADHQARPDQLDRRSPSKGPEPEGLAIGEVDERTYVFVGLERIGGVMVYDITNPESTELLQYINTRDFSIAEDPDADQTKTDLGAEGLYFVPSSESPDANKRPLLLVGNEVSGTTSVFAIVRITE